jgi:putative peptidoglycan lipid II flippase
MTRIMLFSQILFAISGFFSAMLQGTKRFIVPAFTPVFYNLGIAAVVIVGTRWLGLYAAAWGTVFGASLHLLIQIPIIWRIGFRPRWPQWHRDELKELLTMTGPRAVTLVINQLNQFVVTYFATGLGALNLTMITFVQQLMLPPIRFFGVSIGQASLPFLATNHHDLEGFQRMVFRSLRQIAFFAAPSAVLLLVLRVPIVRLAYGTKDLPWRATLQMAEALGILSLSVGPQAITHLLIRAFYALNNTVTPLVVAVVYFLVSAVGGWYFVTQAGMGLRGIAISLSAAGTLEMFLLLLCLIYRVRAHNFAPHLWALLRITIASFVMAVTLFIFQRLFDLYVFETSRVLQLIQLTLLVTALGGTVYLGLCWLLKIEELLILKKLYNSLRFHWRKSTGATPEFVESISHAD